MNSSWSISVLQFFFLQFSIANYSDQNLSKDVQESSSLLAIKMGTNKRSVSEVVPVGFQCVADDTTKHNENANKQSDNL